MKNIPMACIRGGAVRILLALLLGLLVVSGYVVAPILFAKAGSSHEAGRLAGEIFHVVNNGVVIIAVAIAAFWMRMETISRRQWGVLLVVAALAAINEYGVSPIIMELKLAAGPIDQLAADSPLKAQFGMWHGVSATVHLISTVMAVVLLLMGAHKRACSGSKESCKES